ncbi:MAG: hypothetical protein V4648_04625 [Bacteroidota bacterium]
MVEVFKTNVSEESQSQAIVSTLSQQFPSFKINFDLEDCDNILRVEANILDPIKIIELLHSNGYNCEILE